MASCWRQQRRRRRIRPFLKDARDVAELVVADGKPVFLHDVAAVRERSPASRYVWQGVAGKDGGSTRP